MATEEQEIRRAAVQAAIDLKESMEKLSKDMAEIKGVSKRQRSLIRWLAGSVLFDVFLSFALGWVAYEAMDASNEAKTAASEVKVARVAEHESCLETNRVRATQLKLWNDIFNILGPRLPQAEELRALTDGTFQPRQCTPPG